MPRAAHLAHVDDAHAEPLEALVAPRARSCARRPAQTCSRLEHAGGEAVERIVVLAEQPGERHAVQPAACGWCAACGVHVRVDPDQAERPPSCSARATPVQVPPAQLWSPPSTQGRRPRRIASATAEASRPQSLLTASCLRRSVAAGARIGPATQRHAAALRARSASSGASTAGASAQPGSGSAEPPRRADQLDLSLHLYTRFRLSLQARGRTHEPCCCPT